MNILVVEDDADCVRFIQEALGPLCRDLVCTALLHEALVMLKNDFDAVWLDLVLEDAGAETTLATIPEIRKNSPRATLIVVSGYGDTYRRRALDAGADAYASKVDLDGFNRSSVAALIITAAVHAMQRGVDSAKILERVASFFTTMKCPTTNPVVTPC